jgi:hypothetical protein
MRKLDSNSTCAFGAVLAFSMAWISRVLNSARAAQTEPLRLVVCGAPDKDGWPVLFEDRLADFLVRIQIRSESHSELDGAWYRGFDFEKWDYRGRMAMSAGGFGASKPAGSKPGSPPRSRSDT